MFAKANEDEAISKNSRRLYPDFWKDDYILDAKYKRLDGGVGREDLYQVVSYMYCTKSTNCGFAYPSETAQKPINYQLAGYGGRIRIIGVKVFHDTDNFATYVSEMETAEKVLSQ